jgi:hypothetical protein
MLSNFYPACFTHPTLGDFASTEGLWYYLRTGCEYEHCRTVAGLEAKHYGIMLITEDKNVVESSCFIDEFIQGIQAKLRQNPAILLELISTDLPLEHYFIQRGKVKNKGQYRWILNEYDRLRLMTQQWYLEKHGILPIHAVRYHQ